jgi:hypothetical protein
MRLIPGDMAQAFYAAIGPCGCPQAAAETTLMLRDGKLPPRGTTVEHYQEAVAWHRRGEAGDAELVAVALLAHLKPRDYQPQSPRVAAATLARHGEQRLPPLLRTLAHVRLRRIKGMAQEALLGWGAGRYPGLLAMGEVTAAELLEAQAEGLRHVGVGLPLSGFETADDSYPGGFTHHDLCHLAKFYGEPPDPRSYAGQVGFFAAFRDLAAAEPELLERQTDLPPGADISLVASDTNGDVRLLLTLLLARLAVRHGVSGDAATALVGDYLQRLGVPADEARDAAPVFRVARGAFLARIAPHFERRGHALLELAP